LPFLFLLYFFLARATPHLFFRVLGSSFSLAFPSLFFFFFDFSIFFYLSLCFLARILLCLFPIFHSSRQRESSAWVQRWRMGFTVKTEREDARAALAAVGFEFEGGGERNTGQRSGGLGLRCLRWRRRRRLDRWRWAALPISLFFSSSPQVSFLSADSSFSFICRIGDAEWWDCSSLAEVRLVMMAWAQSGQGGWVNWW
jgi:hypothetical protein